MEYDFQEQSNPGFITTKNILGIIAEHLQKSPPKPRKPEPAS
jgi:hypothetical protein